MHKQSTIKEFYSVLHKGKYKEAISLFASDAIIRSPLHGENGVKRFFGSLAKNARKMRVDIKDLYFSPENPNRAIAHIDLYWIAKNGTELMVECIDIFEFVPNSDKMKSLTVIYDACSVQEKLKKSRKKKAVKKKVIKKRVQKKRSK